MDMYRLAKGGALGNHRDKMDRSFQWTRVRGKPVGFVYGNLKES